MKTLTLDYSKWRCGGDDEDDNQNIVGLGETRLLNSNGYMCCLGQFSLQLGISEGEIEDRGRPEELEKEIPLLTVEKEDSILGVTDSCFSNKAIAINDDYSTTPETKIELLSSLCNKNGHKLKVINQPKS